MQDMYNKFVKNFHFMIDHFLDIELSSDGITKELSFWKDTNIGLYVNFASFVPWTCHTSNLQSVS